MTKEHLNDLYGRLESIRSAICNLLKKRNLDASWGFFNGHYHKDEKGIYRCDAYPIPVISVANICDIEIDLTTISVSTRMDKLSASDYDLSHLHHPFEVYGIDDFLHDFEWCSVTASQWKESILASSESEIGFSFYFENDVSAETVIALILFLQKEGFYN